MRDWIWILAVGVGLAILLPFSNTKWAHTQFKARNFTLVDDQDNTRAMLGVNHDGQAVLSMGNANGKPHFMLATDPDGTSILSMRNAKGEVRLVLTVDADGSPKIQMYTADGLPIWKAP